MAKWYTDYEAALYKRTFETMKDSGWFDNVRQGLPFAINQDAYGAFNIGFIMWQAAREDMLEQMFDIADRAQDVEEVLAKLLAIRAKQALQVDAEAMVEVQ